MSTQPVAATEHGSEERVPLPHPSTLFPHRDEPLLIDELLACSQHSLIAGCLVKQSPWWVHGHFPGNPMMLGVLSLEMMAQAAGCHLAIVHPSEKKFGVYSNIENGRFRGIVRPGQDLTILVELIQLRRDTARYKGTIEHDDRHISDAKFTIVRMAELPKE